jgi:hypothetical protein
MSGAAPLGAPLVNGLQSRMNSLGVNVVLAQGRGILILVIYTYIYHILIIAP